MAGHVGTLGMVDTVPAVETSALTLAYSLSAGPNLVDITTDAGRYSWSSL